MTGWILAVLGLFVVQTFLPSAMRARSGGADQITYLRSNRDQRPPAPVMTGRMERALRNMLEALPVFLPLALLAEIKGVEDGWALTGAAVFFLARLAYIPAYATGIPLFRSAIWTVGHAGLVMMVVGILG